MTPNRLRKDQRAQSGARPRRLFRQRRLPRQRRERRALRELLPTQNGPWTLGMGARARQRLTMGAGGGTETRAGHEPLPRDFFWLRWKQVTVDGRRAEYGEAGEGPPVVFLHGWGLDHRAYKRALSRLAAAGVRVIAPALPGFGGTAAVSDEHFTLAGLGAWTADFLDALEVRDHVLVIGHSFGGGVAITFAHDHPQRVKGLVLVNSIGASAWAKRGSAQRALSDRPLWDWGIHLPRDLWPLGQARKVLPVVLTEAAGNLARDPRSFVKAAGLARSANLLEELEELKERRLPVVVLWGERDRIVTRDAFEEMCMTLGQPQSVTVEGSHAWLIADPDTFGEVMTNVVGVADMARALPTRHPLRAIRSIAVGHRKGAPSSVDHDA